MASPLAVTLRCEDLASGALGSTFDIPCIKYTSCVRVSQDAKADTVVRSVAGERIAVWCVCDGHHGQGAAAFVARQCADELLHKLREEPPCSPGGGDCLMALQTSVFLLCSLPQWSTREDES